MTFIIKTGKRTWTLYLKGVDIRGKVLESESGKEYILAGRELSATRIGRDGKTRLYTWSVTKKSERSGAMAKAA